MSNIIDHIPRLICIAISLLIALLLIVESALLVLIMDATTKSLELAAGIPVVDN